MRSGVIQQIDTPDAIYEQPANLFVAGFLGSPSMNFVEGRLETDSGALYFCSAAMRLDVSAYPFVDRPESGRPVVLGFRPEHVLLTGATGFAATVSVTEPMGDHQIVWLDMQGLAVSLTTDKQVRVTLDQTVHFDLDRQRISLFDQASGARI